MSAHERRQKQSSDESIDGTKARKDFDDDTFAVHARTVA